eukprot:scaffold29627_cov80-Skeletonema_marinoi.AAC.1
MMLPLLLTSSQNVQRVHEGSIRVCEYWNGAQIKQCGWQIYLSVGEELYMEQEESNLLSVKMHTNYARRRKYAVEECALSSARQQQYIAFGSE